MNIAGNVFPIPFYVYFSEDLIFFAYQEILEYWRRFVPSAQNVRPENFVCWIYLLPCNTVSQLGHGGLEVKLRLYIKFQKEIQLLNALVTLLICLVFQRFHFVCASNWKFGL